MDCSVHQKGAKSSTVYTVGFFVLFFKHRCVFPRDAGQTAIPRVKLLAHSAKWVTSGAGWLAVWQQPSTGGKLLLTAKWTDSYFSRG